jgi:hypothetical protein
MDSEPQVSMGHIMPIILALTMVDFCLFFFQNRALFNKLSFRQWQTLGLVSRIARNINHVYLMNDNSCFYDYICWINFDKNINGL